MPLVIDDKFVNVDLDSFGFARGYHDAGLPKGTRPRYSDKEPLIPESQWKALIDQMDAENTGGDYLVTRIYDQNGEGSCVANACSQALEIIQAKQFGKESVVHLSAMSLYKRIGSGPNSGANCDDGLDEILKRGVLPLDNPENRAKFGNAVMPNCGWREKYPANWEVTAKRFRALEWLRCESVAETITALLKRHPVVVGREGHSICYVRPAYRSGDIAGVYANSWGDWGFAAGGLGSGFGADTGRTLRSAADWAFAIRAVTEPN